MTHPISRWPPPWRCSTSIRGPNPGVTARRRAGNHFGKGDKSHKEVGGHGGTSYAHRGGEGGGGGGQGTATPMTARKVSRRVLLARHLLPRQETKSCASSTHRRKVFQEMFTVPSRKRLPVPPTLRPRHPPGGTSSLGSTTTASLASLTNICRVGVRRMGPDSSQWCPATGQGATGTNWSRGSSS